MPLPPKDFIGRGAGANPANPFERLLVEDDADYLDELARDPEAVRPGVKTLFFRDDSQSIISRNTSPDLPFSASVNPYRGCEHGCAYCYARRYHEFLGFSSGLDFESRILVKPEAPTLLHQELAARSWKPQVLNLSGVTDCYQPIERRLKITRGCLEVLAEFRNPVVVITKNHLITRDADVLAKLAHYQSAAAILSLTTLDAELARELEPRASSPRMRLEALTNLAAAGVPVGVSVAPLIPGLNDHEVPAILEAARAAGAQFAVYGIVRLPGSVAEIFSNWLDRRVSAAAKEKILGRVREIRQGSLNELRPGYRMSGHGHLAEQVGQLFRVSARRLGLDQRHLELSSTHFRRVEPGQMELF